MRRVKSFGTENAMVRPGDEPVARLPRRPGPAGDARHELSRQTDSRPRLPVDHAARGRRRGTAAGCVPSADRAVPTRAAVGPPAADAATAQWEEAGRAPEYAGPSVWAHDGLSPGNLLVHEGRLTAGRGSRRRVGARVAGRRRSR